MKSFTLLAASTLALGVAAAPATSKPLAQGPPVTQAEFDLFKRASGFSLATYTNCSSVMGAKILKRLDNMAHGLILQDDAKKQIIVAMQGTSSTEDFDIDADAIKTPWSTLGSEGCGEGCSVHEGFNQAVSLVQDDVMATVKAAKEANKDYKILVTGHSLGGAECILLSVPLRKEYKDDVTAVCLAAPRLATPKMSDYIEALFTPGSFYRLTSTDDGVPRVLQTSLGFRHTGNEYWIKKEPAQGPEDIVNCGSDESPDCNNQFGPSYDTFGVNDHHLQYIVSYITPTCDGGAGVAAPQDWAAADNE